MNRRTLLKTAALGSFALPAVLNVPFSSQKILAQDIESYQTKGPIKQSVSKWCFGKYSLADFIPLCKQIGLVGVDLIDPGDWDMMLQNDMIVTMGNVPGCGIPSGFNRKRNHDKLVKTYEQWIPVAAEKKVPNIICFSGNRNGISDEEGLEVSVEGLKRIAPIAEKYGINVCMELLNSKDHRDYQCDHTAWGGEMCRRVGSERIKVLFDIYHMQRMDGDLVNNIREYKDIIGHYHTGGNPGRNDIDDSQEIYYPAVMKAILETGYNGYVAHEFLPKDDLRSLRRAAEICDIVV